VDFAGKLREGKRADFLHQASPICMMPASMADVMSRSKVRLMTAVLLFSKQENLYV
jgi:hypothetical protein